MDENGLRLFCVTQDGDALEVVYLTAAQIAVLHRHLEGFAVNGPAPAWERFSE